MWRWLAACAPVEPDAWQGVEQAVVWDAGTVVVDRSVSRRNPDLTVLRTVDRCRWVRAGDGLREEGCVVGPPGRSTLSRRGPLLLDERYDDQHRRTLLSIDPVTLRPLATVPLGLEPEALVPGGSLFVERSAVLVVVNHGLSGEDVPDGDGRATFTVERWDGEVLAWRRGLERFPEEAHHVDGTLAVKDQGEWRLFDTATGAPRSAPVPARPGACLDRAGLSYLSADDPPARVRVPLDGGPPALTEAGPLPGWTGGCVLRDGAPWFHGGDDDGSGWALGPAGERAVLPRVDVEVGRHVDVDGAWWLVELGRGYVVWDPAAGVARTAPHELHDVVRVGSDLVAYGVGVDLELWIRSRTGSWRRPHRVSPRPWHVADGRLWTFAHRTAADTPAVEVLTLPDLQVAESWGALPTP
jgi:hypothetical protein